MAVFADKLMGAKCQLHFRRRAHAMGLLRWSRRLAFAAIVLSNLDAPRKLVQFRGKALLPDIARIANQITIDPAGTAAANPISGILERLRGAER